METSEAAKTVRAKWSGSFAPGEPGPSTAGEHTMPASEEVVVKDEVQDNAHHSQQPNNVMAKVLEILTRIAAAVERLADQGAAAATSSVVVPVVNVSAANNPAASIMPAAVAPPISSSVNHSQLFIEMSDDSDEEMEPGKRCGVCKGPCEVMNALDCGHYPFCGTCVEAMTAKANTVLHKFKCPYCNKIVKDTLELNLL